MLRSIERFLEEGLERRIRRWLRASLQPVELAKAAARAMEASQRVGPSGPQVANRYQLRLHPSDFQRFEGFPHSLTLDVEQYLDDEAKRLGLRPVDVWVVEVEPDEQVSPGRVEVGAAMIDVASARQAPEQTIDLEHTQRAPVIPNVRAQPRGALVIGEERYPLAKPLTRIGRALDNDLVLSDNRISRYHAQVELQGDRCLIRDLASTNGISIRGRRITEAVLATGDEISLGGLVVRFEPGP